MSLAAMIWCARLPEKVSPAERVTLLVLAEHHNGETGLCCPTIKRIAEFGHLEQSTVTRATKTLTALGLIEVDHGMWATNGRGITNRYQLKIPTWAFDIAAGKDGVGPGDEAEKDGISKKKGCDRPIEPGSNLKESTCPNGHGLPARDLLGEVITPNTTSEAADEEERLATEAQAATDIWNRYVGAACGPVLRLTDARRKKLKKRLGEDFGGHLHGWARYCRRIAASPFLTGDNDRGWRASFDWVLEPRNLVRIEEGKYDRRNPVRSSGGGELRGNL